MSHIDLSSPDGWDRWVHGPDPVKPKKVTAAAYAAMDEHDRWDYDESRRAWHSTPEFFDTPRLYDFQRTFFRAVRSQRGIVTLKRGMGLSAPGNSGKTIAIANYCRNHQLEIEEHDPSLRDALPVLWTEAVSPKEIDFYLSLAEPLDLPCHGMNVTVLRSAVIRALKRERTEVIVADEGQRLYPKTAEGEKTTYRMRHISNKTGVVWVVAGVALDDTGMFGGKQASSTARRWPLTRIQPFVFGNETPNPHGQLSDHDFWMAAVKTLEDRLILHSHTKGTLVKEAEYLWGRTGGVLGSLADLIEQAAYDAIESGDETITKDILDAVSIDEAANEDYQDYLAEKELAKKGKGKGKGKADKPIGTNTRNGTTTKTAKAIEDDDAAAA